MEYLWLAQKDIYQTSFSGIQLYSTSRVDYICYDDEISPRQISVQFLYVLEPDIYVETIIMLAPS